MDVQAEPAGGLLDGLGSAQRQLLDAAGEAASAADVDLYLVGGAVRDLLLGRPTLDLDLVVEGDAGALAERLAARLGGRARSHDAFLTARVELPDGRHLDLATARADSYGAAARLPEVRPAALEEDLARRDFTVNAMALVLPAGRDEAPIDPFGGRDDLERGQLRILHPASFRDDPTRALRGVRLELRLGLAFESETERLLREAAVSGVFDELSGDRLCRELRLALEEPVGAAALWRRLGELGLLEAVGLPAAETALSELERAERAAGRLSPFPSDPQPRRWLLLLAAALSPLEAGRRARAAARLALAGGERELFARARERVDRALAELGSGEVAPHRAERALSGLAPEELVLVAARGGRAAEAWVERYLEELAPLELAIGGDDLLRAGVAPGTELGRALRATREARLDGRIGADGELQFALSFLRGEAS